MNGGCHSPETRRNSQVCSNKVPHIHLEPSSPCTNNSLLLKNVYNNISQYKKKINFLLCTAITFYTIYNVQFKVQKIHIEKLVILIKFNLNKGHQFR